MSTISGIGKEWHGNLPGRFNLKGCITSEVEIPLNERNGLSLGRKPGEAINLYLVSSNESRQIGSIEFKERIASNKTLIYISAPGLAIRQEKESLTIRETTDLKRGIGRVVKVNLGNDKIVKPGVVINHQIIVRFERHGGTNIRMRFFAPKNVLIQRDNAKSFP